MKIIISPAKKMNIDVDTFDIKGVPDFLDRVEEIKWWIQDFTVFSSHLMV